SHVPSPFEARTQRTRDCASLLSGPAVAASSEAGDASSVPCFIKGQTSAQASAASAEAPVVAATEWTARPGGSTHTIRIPLNNNGIMSSVVAERRNMKTYFKSPLSSPPGADCQGA